jgi:hypothetical protein
MDGSITRDTAVIDRQMAEKANYMTKADIGQAAKDWMDQVAFDLKQARRLVLNDPAKLAELERIAKMYDADLTLPLPLVRGERVHHLEKSSVLFPRRRLGHVVKLAHLPHDNVGGLSFHLDMFDRLLDSLGLGDLLLAQVAVLC